MPVPIDTVNHLRRGQLGVEKQARVGKVGD